MENPDSPLQSPESLNCRAAEVGSLVFTDRRREAWGLYKIHEKELWVAMQYAMGAVHSPHSSAAAALLEAGRPAGCWLSWPALLQAYLLKSQVLRAWSQRAAWKHVREQQQRQALVHWRAQQGTGTRGKSRQGAQARQKWWARRREANRMHEIDGCRLSAPCAAPQPHLALLQQQAPLPLVAQGPACTAA